MATIKDILNFDFVEPKCSFCGYEEHPICLTAHHVFPRNHFNPQPNFDREDRYIILCPTCHILLHRGIFVKDGKQFIKNAIDYCEIKYIKVKKVDKIIELARKVYGIKPKDLNTS